MSPDIDKTSPLPTSFPPPRSTAFRFKTKRPRPPSPSSSDPISSNPHRSSRRHRHRRHRSHHFPTPPSTTPTLDPDTAFRESLFDALADDEGAAFWESVYGQPIHNYSPYYASSTTANGDPEIERMTDEEYTAHVRAKMWEKSHGYIAEERKMREAERDRRRREERDKGIEGEKRERERKEWERRVDNVLGRREEKKWRVIWEGYVKAWEKLKVIAEEAAAVKDVLDMGAQRTDMEPKPKMRKWNANMIHWPTRSGSLKDVNSEAVEEFLRRAPQSEKKGEEVDLVGVLKVERVRWHPDKMQQRYGALGIDDGTRQGVTAVFQIVDRMWTERREKMPL